MGDKKDAREKNGTLLETAGWVVCDVEAGNMLTTRGQFRRIPEGVI
jgi:hypothetical protein